MGQGRADSLVIGKERTVTEIFLEEERGFEENSAGGVEVSRYGDKADGAKAQG